MQIKFSKWIPSLLIMLVIFIFSSQPSDKFPDFDWADSIIKKGGHMLGYGFLALSYWYALGWEGKLRWLAWLAAVLFAFTDEFHQSFVPGRRSSLWDVLVFDNLGAIISLWLADASFKQKRPEFISSDRSESPG